MDPKDRLLLFLQDEQTQVEERTESDCDLISKFELKES